MNPVILLILGGIAIYALGRTGQTLLKLTFDVKNARIHNVSLSYSNIYFDLIINNPTSKDAIIQAYNAQVIYEGKVLATIFKEGLKVPVKRNDTTIIKNIVAKVNSLTVVEKIIDAMTGQFSGTIQIKGTVLADGIKFPFDTKIKLIPQNQ
jgi:hypothetical protein